MAEETKPKKGKKHLHRHIIESVHDKNGKHTGYAHYEQYKEKATDHHAEPEKVSNVSDTAEEAGQHATEQFAAQEGAQGGGGAASSGEAEPGEADAAAGAPAAGAAPAAGM